MDLEGVPLGEVSQRRRNILSHPLYVGSKKKWYKWIYETRRLTDLENELMVACTPLCLPWRASKALLDSTGSSAQSSVMT